MIRSDMGTEKSKNIDKILETDKNNIKFHLFTLCSIKSTEIVKKNN